jgi:hypothetical protein
LLGACGGGGGGGTVSAAQYVKVACTDLSAWVKSIQQGASELQTANPSSAEEGKKLFTNFYENVITATGKLEDQLKAAGAPDVEKGDTIASNTVAAIDKVRTLLEQSRSRVENLPTNSPQAFSRAVQAAGQAVQNSFQQVDLSNTINSPELSAAASKEPACQSLNA